MKHIIDFRNTSDTGEIDSDAVVPYNNGEAANQTVLRRPIENTRTRTEILRKAVREDTIMRDVDRNDPCVWGGGTITFNGTVAGGGDGKFTITSSVFVVPMLTAGDGVGATAPYIASTKASLTVGTLGDNQVIIESVKKQFEGSNLAKADANRLSVEILNDTSETIALEGATGDVNNIKITIISGTTTAQGLIDLINNDATVNQYVSASLEATSTGTNAADLWGPTQWGSDYTQRFLTGGVSGVVHEVPLGSISSFFAAHAENPLQKGDTLAIYYNTIIDDSGTGGVLQSNVENSNTSIGAGSLFNTRREPEKCANAIPLCKCIDDDTLLFVSGAYIKKDIPATLYTDSSAETILAEIVAARNSVTFGAKASLDARIEAVDTHAAAIVTVGPTSSGRMYEGTSALYNAINAYKDIGGIILVDPGDYTLDASLYITKSLHIIGKGAAETRLLFGTNTLTINGTADAAKNSGITGMYLDTSTTGIQLDFNDSWCFLHRCYFTIEIRIHTDATYFTMLDCESNVDARTSTTVNATHVHFQHCKWYNNSSGDYSIINISSNYVSFNDCELYFAGGNRIYNTGAYTSYYNTKIEADLDVSAAGPLLKINTGSVIEGLRVIKKGSNHIVQAVLEINGGSARNVYITCNATELRLSGTYLIYIVSPSTSYVATLDTFQITNFYLPFDTNTLNVSEPLIDLYSHVDAEVYLRNGMINNMSHNTASGDMNVCLIGSSTTTGGPNIIENVCVDTSGITYGTGARNVFARMTDNSYITRCRILGTGLFTIGIDLYTLSNVEISHNKFMLIGAWAFAIHAYDSNHVRFVNNDIIFDGNLTSNIVYFQSSSTSYRCTIAHNSIKNIGSSWTTAEGISLYGYDSSIVFGNIVPANVGTSHIEYNSCTNMMPVEASLGTYNVLT